MDPATDPYIRGTLAYKSADLNGDGYPEVVYNAMFDVANSNPPLYRGEVWMAINPGPGNWDTALAKGGDRRRQLGSCRYVDSRL